MISQSQLSEITLGHTQFNNVRFTSDNDSLMHWTG